MTARVRLVASPGVAGSLSGTCEYFDQAACIGNSLGVHEEVLPLADTAGFWIRLDGEWTAPNLSASVMCSYGLAVPGGESFDAYLDDLGLQDRAAIFADGFESGHMSAWSGN